MSAILKQLALGLGGHLDERAADDPVMRLESRDPAVGGKRQADLVETFQQTALAKRIDLEAKAVLIGGGYRLGFEVDRDRLVPRGLEQAVDRLLRQDDRKNAVLERIARE